MRLLLALLTTIVFSSPAHAHSPLRSVTPRDGAILKEAPTRIELVFMAPVRLTKVVLTKRGAKMTPGGLRSALSSVASGGAETAVALPAGPLREKRSVHQIALPALDRGAYAATWRALGEDGHVLKGRFSFALE